MPGLLSFSNDLQCQFHLYKWFISAFSKHQNHRYDPEQLTQYIKIKSSLSSVVLSNLLSLKKKKKKRFNRTFLWFTQLFCTIPMGKKTSSWRKSDHMIRICGHSYWLQI